MIDELNKVKPSTVYIVGGNGAISDSTMQQIKHITGAAVKRLWGQNIYDTLLAIVNEFNQTVNLYHLLQIQTLWTHYMAACMQQIIIQQFYWFLIFL
jgi:putative cell wall-binding protein